jgi:hypothetical protein
MLVNDCGAVDTSADACLLRGDRAGAVGPVRFFAVKAAACLVKSDLCLWLSAMLLRFGATLPVGGLCFTGFVPACFAGCFAVCVLPPGVFRRAVSSGGIGGHGAGHG